MACGETEGLTPCAGYWVIKMTFDAARTPTGMQHTFGARMCVQTHAALRCIGQKRAVHTLFGAKWADLAAAAGALATALVAPNDIVFPTEGIEPLRESTIVLAAYIFLYRTYGEFLIERIVYTVKARQRKTLIEATFCVPLLMDFIGDTMDDRAVDRRGSSDCAAL